MKIDVIQSTLVGNGNSYSVYTDMHYIIIFCIAVTSWPKNPLF